MERGSSIVREGLSHGGNARGNLTRDPTTPVSLCLGICLGAGTARSIDEDPRDATRGGVNGPALPVQPPADGKISPLSINEAR
jgi:hypothetical protein